MCIYVYFIYLFYFSPPQLWLSRQKLDQALELKYEYEADMTPAAYAMLINLCCRHDNAEEALKLKREL